MSYLPSNLLLMAEAAAGAAKWFLYRSTDPLAAVTGPGYITDALDHEMSVGDLVLVQEAASPVYQWLEVARLAAGAADLVDGLKPPDGLAPITSPRLNGTPLSPTPGMADATTRIATTEWVQAQAYLRGNQRITLDGDVTGTGTTHIKTVAVGLHGQPISSTVPQDGQVLVWDGVAWAPAPPVGATGAKGDKGDKGDTGDTGPQGEAGTATAGGTVGQVQFHNVSHQLAGVTMSGDATWDTATGALHLTGTGPFLPLVGGTVTGPGNLTVHGKGNFLATDYLTPIYLVENARLAALADATYSIGLVGGARTSDRAPGLYASAIGVSGAAMSDQASGFAVAWGGYFEGRAMAGVHPSAGTQGIEVNIANHSGTAGGMMTPYALQPNGRMVGLSVLSGGGDATDVAAAVASVALLVSNNTARFHKGLLFDATALTAIGGGGNGVAIEMARGQSLRWLNSGGTTDTEIWGNANGLITGGAFTVGNNANPTLRLNPGYTVLFAPDGSGGTAGIFLGDVTSGGSINVHRNLVHRFENRNGSALFAQVDAGRFEVPGTGKFYVADTPPAVITRLSDRLFVGQVANTYPGGPTDSTWLATWNGLNNLSLAQFGVLSTNGTNAVLGASRSSDWGSLNVNRSIGGCFYGVNDRTDASASWGIYVEGNKAAGQLGFTAAAELDIANYGATVDITPYTHANPAGTSLCLWLVSGQGASINPASAAIGIDAMAAGREFRKGIVVEASGLDTSLGTGGGGVAVELARGQSIRWMNSGGTIDAEIWGNTSGLVTSKPGSIVDQLTINSSGPATGYIARPNTAGLKSLTFAVQGGGLLDSMTLNVTGTAAAGWLTVGAPTVPGGGLLTGDVNAQRLLVNGVAALTASGISGMTAGQIPIAASATTITSSGNLSGDVTTAGSLATAIASNAVVTAKINNAAVTYAKIQNVANNRLLGNTSGSAAAPSEIVLPLAVALGGTNATTAAAALTSLGAAPLASPSFTGNVSVAGSITVSGHANPTLGDYAGYTTLWAADGSAGTSGINIGPASTPDSYYRNTNHYISNRDGSGAYVAITAGGITFGGPTGGAKGAATLNAVGVYAQGTLLTSDARVKRDIEPVPDDCLARVAAVEPKTFRFIEGEGGSPGFFERRHWGFTAQDMREALPDAVEEDEAGNLSISQGDLIACLWKSVRELSAHVARLERGRAHGP